MLTVYNLQVAVSMQELNKLASDIKNNKQAYN